MKRLSPFLMFFLIFLISLFFTASVLLAGTGRYSHYRQTTKPRLSAGALYHLGLLNNELHIPKPFAAQNLFKPQNPFSLAGAPTINGPVTESINYTQDSDLNGGAQVPPDNAGCVGPNHFLIAVNTAIEWYTKTDRVQQNSESLNTFFEATNPSDLFDPRVVYDSYAHRYIVIADEQSSSPSNINYIHLAVSKTDDPNDGWYFQRINTKTTINAKETWLDFPGLAVSNEAIYITGNMFDFNNSYVASRLWILDKGLYNGNDTSAVHIYDLSTEAGLGSQSFTNIPAIMSGPQPLLNGDTVGTFLISSEWDNGNGDDDMIAVYYIVDPLGHSGNPVFTVQFLNPGQIHNNAAGVPEAPQNGGNATIDFGDDRAQSAFWRGDTLLGAFTVNPPAGPDSGQATVFWFAANTSDLFGITLDQQGNVGGEDIAAQTFTGFPAIACNNKGDIAIGFSASASTIYAGSYFTVHQSSDAPGQLQPSQAMHLGEDYYLRTFNPFHVGNRWGDYSSIALDPSNEYNFWIFNQYAWTKGDYDPFSKEDGRWATSFAQIDPSGTQASVKSDRKLILRTFALEQNYPNPFNPTTLIRYQLKETGKVTLGIYNSVGQKITTLVNKVQNAGVHEVRFDGSHLPSGIYFCTLKQKNHQAKIKMILLK